MVRRIRRKNNLENKKIEDSTEKKANTLVIDLTNPIDNVFTKKEINPEIEKLFQQGIDFYKKGELDKAYHCFYSIIRINPNDAPALHKLACVHWLKKEPEQALRYVESAIKINPYFVNAYKDLIVIAKASYDWEKIINAYQTLLKITNKNAKILNDYALDLTFMGKYSEAIIVFEELIKSNQHLKLAKIALVKCYEATGNHNRAINLLENMVSSDDEEKNTASWYLARYLLQDNRTIEEGFNLYENALNTKFRKINVLDDVLFWQGESLTSKNIALLKEQGAAEEVLFASNYSQIIALADNVIIEADELLVPILARSFNQAVVVSKIENANNIDYQCPIGSLNHILYQKNKTLNFPKQYLIPDIVRADFWQRKLSKLSDKPKIGICWRGEKIKTLEKDIYPEVYDFAAFADINDVEFINLQHDDSFAETALLESQYGIKVNTVFVSDKNANPYEEAVALLSNIDLVISIQGTATNLASALGIETWILDKTHLENDNCERLPLDLPNIKRFVKTKNNSWADLIENDIKSALLAKIENGFSQKPKYQIPSLSEKQFEAEINRFFEQKDTKTSSDIFKIIEKKCSLLNFNDAKKILFKFLEFFPDYPEALYYLGKIAICEKDNNLAKKYITKAYNIKSNIYNLKFDYDYINQNNDKVVVDEDLREKEELKDEELEYKDYLILDAEKYLKEEKWYDALKSVEALYSQTTEKAEVVSLYARILLIFNKVDKVIEICNKYLSQNPLDENIRELLFKATFILKTVEESFRETIYQNHYELPLWQGENVGDKTILISKKTSLENEILLANFYNFVLQLSKNCIIEASENVIPVLENSFKKARFVTSKDVERCYQDADFEVNANNLFCLYYQKENKIYFKPKYLKPISSRLFHWKKQLNKNSKEPKIGIFWYNLKETPDINLKAEDLSEFLKISGISFFNLSNVEIANSNVDNLNISLLDDLVEASAILSNLDLVITVPSVVASLSSALGVETIILQNGNYNDEVKTKLNTLCPDCSRILFKNTSQTWQNFISKELIDIVSSHNKFVISVKVATQKKLGLNKPNTISQLYKKALDLKENKEFKDAKVVLDLILGAVNDQIEALFLYGQISEEENDLEKAEKFFRKAIMKDASITSIISSFIKVLVKQEKFDEASEYITKLIDANKKDTKYYHHIVIELHNAGRFGDAKRLLEKCLELNPNHYETLVNLSNTYFYLGEYKRSIELLRLARIVDSSSFKATWNLAIKLVDYEETLEEALKYYEDGLATKTREPYRKFSVPKWNGEDISDKKLLVYREQGIGDELAYAAFLNEAVKSSKTCIYEASPRLVSLFKRSFPNAVVMAQKVDVSNDINRKDIDIYCPLASLRYVYYKKYQTVNDYKPYLVPDNDEKQKWKQRLDEISSKPKVGICWRSGLITAKRLALYAKIEDYADLFRNDAVDFINLQYGDCQEELDSIKEKYGLTIHNMEGINLKAELDRVSALMANMDLVISSQTAVDEMASGLGINTWSVSIERNENLPQIARLPVFPANRICIQKPVKVEWKQMITNVVVPKFQDFIDSLEKR